MSQYPYDDRNLVNYQTPIDRNYQTQQSRPAQSPTQRPPQGYSNAPSHNDYPTHQPAAYQQTNYPPQYGYYPQSTSAYPHQPQPSYNTYPSYPQQITQHQQHYPQIVIPPPATHVQPRQTGPAPPQYAQSPQQTYSRPPPNVEAEPSIVRSTAESQQPAPQYQMQYNRQQPSSSSPNLAQYAPRAPAPTQVTPRQQQQQSSTIPISPITIRPQQNQLAQRESVPTARPASQETRRNIVSIDVPGPVKSQERLPSSQGLHAMGASNTQQYSAPKVKKDRAPSPKRSQLPTMSSAQAQRPPQTSVPQSVTRPAPQQIHQPLDHRVLFLSLAEEYINAAHELGPRIAADPQSEDRHRYFQLMTTGLSCLEATLKNVRLPLREEASLSLQYATLLHTETQNSRHLDEILSRQILKTDQAKLFDLKYSMQHLQIQALNVSNPRAARKAIDKIISDANLLGHIPWVYAFRFLRISLSMSSKESSLDVGNAIVNAREIVSLAEVYSDDPIIVIGSAIEATLHLSDSVSAERYEHAQAAIAKARSRQFNLHDSLQHLWTYVDCVDTACHLVHSNMGRVEKCVPTLENALKFLQKPERSKNRWPDDGVLLLPIRAEIQEGLTKDTNGIFQHTAKGRPLLRLAWLNTEDLTTTVKLLLGICKRLKPSYSSKEGLADFEDVLRPLKSASGESNEEPTSELPTRMSLRAACEAIHRKEDIDFLLRIRVVMLHATAGRWDLAEKHCKELTSAARSSTSADIQIWTAYIRAVVLQGTGHLTEALAEYQKVQTVLSQGHPAKAASARNDLLILSTLHAIIIQQTLSPLPDALDRMYNLEKLVTNHPNYTLRSAVYMVRTLVMDTVGNAVTSDPTQSTMTLSKRKLSLQEALNVAKLTKDSQMLALIMTLLTTMLFRGVLGQQASKMSYTSMNLTQTLANPLLRMVGEGLVAELLQSEGDDETKIRRLHQSIQIQGSKVPDEVRRQVMPE